MLRIASYLAVAFFVSACVPQVNLGNVEDVFTERPGAPSGVTPRAENTFGACDARELPDHVLNHMRWKHAGEEFYPHEHTRDGTVSLWKGYPSHGLGHYAYLCDTYTGQWIKEGVPDKGYGGGYRYTQRRLPSPKEQCDRQRPLYRHGEGFNTTCGKFRTEYGIFSCRC